MYWMSLLVFLGVFLFSFTSGLHVEDQTIFHAEQEMEVVQTIRESKTKFTGTIVKHYNASASRGDVTESNAQLSKELSYETAWTKTGKRKLTIVKVLDRNVSQVQGSTDETFSSMYDPYTGAEEPDDLPKVLKYWKHRARREIFGKHRRYYIPARSFSQRFPFAVVVKISTGCTGTLVSSRHVLTSAHCLHNGKDYVKGFRTLRVGLLLSNKTLEWIPALQVKMAIPWVQGNDTDASRFDYAIIKLARRHKRQPMPITYSQGNRFGRLTKIHFTAFEDDKPSNTIWYRSCFIMTANRDMFFHCCDAKPGSSGAGIYVYSNNRQTAEQERLVIGVFSGNRHVPYAHWWPYVGCPPVWRGNFNAGIRINEYRFKQICHWVGMKHSMGDCRVYLQSLPSREPPRRPPSPRKHQSKNRKRRGREAKKRGRSRSKKSKRRKRGKKSGKTSKKAKQ